MGTLFSFPLCLFCCCVGLNVFIFSIKFIVSFDFKPSLGRELEGILFKLYDLLLPVSVVYALQL